MLSRRACVGLSVQWMRLAVLVASAQPPSPKLSHPGSVREENLQEKCRQETKRKLTRER